MSCSAEAASNRHLRVLLWGCSVAPTSAHLDVQVSDPIYNEYWGRFIAPFVELGVPEENLWAALLPADGAPSDHAPATALHGCYAVQLLHTLKTLPR
jgi:hypothetical protein